MAVPVELKPTPLAPIIPKQDLAKRKSLEIATTNEDKLKEFQEILSEIDLVGISLKLNEVQSESHEEVVSHKAKEAYYKNNGNPTLVEDTALFIPDLEEDFPGTFVRYWTNTRAQRKRRCEELTRIDSDRYAQAQTLLAVFDGEEIHIRRGVVKGKIAERPRGSGWGWDDIFIPEGQPESYERTFGEMTSDEKNKISMRKEAARDLLKNPIEVGKFTIRLPEPFEHELERVRIEELLNKQAIDFAFSIESIETVNDPNINFNVPNYAPIILSDNTFYTRYSTNTDSPSLGLVTTNMEEDRVETTHDGFPVVYQMGPKRRRLALIQRAALFLEAQSQVVQQRITDIENGEIHFPHRPHRRHLTLEKILGSFPKDFELSDQEMNTFLNSATFKELTYKIRSVKNKKLSRNTGIENATTIKKIGLYPRESIGFGSLAAVSGQRDVVATAAIANALTFIPRNSLFAGEVDRQIDLVNAAKSVINKVFEGDNQKIQRVERNIGVAIGCADPSNELENVKRLYNEAGVKLFRIYTINHDYRVVETARMIRQYFDSQGIYDVEIAVGQIADKAQAQQLIADDIRADMLIFGHGTGRQCTSGENGMGVTTLEELYKVTRDPAFDKTSILVESGVSEHVIIPLILGVDGVLYNQQLVRGTIESGDLFLKEKKTGHMVQPYIASASASTMVIESKKPELRKSRMSIDGMALNTEGKTGFMRGEKKGRSIRFYFDKFRRFISKAFADLGVVSIEELWEMINEISDDVDIFRIPTEEAQAISKDYGNRT